MDLFDRAMLYLVVGLLFLGMLPNIRRGSRVLWARWRVRPPVSWWRALPDWCGWGIVMSAFALFFHWWPPGESQAYLRYPWIVTIGMIGMFWSMVGVIHAGRAIDRILSAHFANRRRLREQRRHMEGHDAPFEGP